MKLFVIRQFAKTCLNVPFDDILRTRRQERCVKVLRKIRHDQAWKSLHCRLEHRRDYGDSVLHFGISTHSGLRINRMAGHFNLLLTSSNRFLLHLDHRHPHYTFENGLSLRFIGERPQDAFQTVHKHFFVDRCDRPCLPPDSPHAQRILFSQFS
jgi:hypothetical protein